MSLDVIGFAAINEDRIKYINAPVEEHETFSPKPLHNLPYDERFLGGSVVNTIVGLTRLGLRTALVGKLGNDESAKFLENELTKNNITFHAPKAKGGSSIAYITVGSNKQRSIKINPGVNDTMTWDDIAPFQDLIKNAKLIHTASFACAFNRYDSLQTQVKIAHEAKKFSFAPGTLYCADIYKKQPNLIDDLLWNTDILVLNKKEAECLTELGYVDAAQKLIEKYGIQNIAITLGTEGCVVFNEKEMHRIPAYKAEPVDLTGAGDAFVTGFLYGYLKGKSLEECGKLGNKVAAYCIQKKGAIEGLPTEAQLLHNT